MVLLTKQEGCSLTSFSFLCLYHGDLRAGEEALILQSLLMEGTVVCVYMYVCLCI